MTVHQLHYTSCEDGLEGIQGFQITAMTPGAPRQLVDLAVRASVYEVAPSIMARLDETDPSVFPVAFGYVPCGGAATLFQSRYLGADFTGRTGNYFAHALLLNSAEAALAGVLPIDMWRSPTWVHTRQNGTDLPLVPALSPGSATDPVSVRRFLASPGRFGRLAQLIGAAQGLIGGGRGRLVLVVPDDHTGALWLAALCRSLPRALGLEISFVTYTARPEDTTVLVSCTTPDVRLPAYGDFTVVDLTEGGSQDGEMTRYGTVLARLWENDDVAVAHQFAQRVSPPLTGADLEAFAVVLECATGRPAATPPAERLLLAAARLTVDRLPGTLTDTSWHRLCDQLIDGPTDLTGWAELLQSADRRGEPVHAGLLGAYYVAALAEPRRLWLPVLTAEELADVAEHAVLPALADPRSAAILGRLGDQQDLIDALVRVLQRRLANHEETTRLATTLSPEAAQLLRKVAPAGRTALLADLVLARNGQGDRVRVLVRARHDTGWQRLGEVLWPDDPNTEEAMTAVSELPTDVLRGTGLLARITLRLKRLIERDELGPKEIRLIDALLDDRVTGELSQQDAEVFEAARLIDQFRRSTPKQRATQAVLAGLTAVGRLPADIGDRLVDSMVVFSLRADGMAHRELLLLALESGSRRFFTTYRKLAGDRLSKAAPGAVATMIVIWWSLPDTRLRQQLTNETLAGAMAKRRAKHLDQVGDLLVATAKKLPIDVPAPNNSWRTWWKTWRSQHERRGLLGMLGLRKGAS